MRNRHVRIGTGALPIVLAAAGAAALAGEARAADLKVPRKYPTIEAAQQVAQPGDRIVVTKGRHKGVIVHAPGVTVVGRGSARLEGMTYVAGEGSAVEGFRVDGVISLVGDGSRAEGLRLRRRGAAILAMSGHGATIRGNRADRTAEIQVGADGVTVEANRFGRGSILVEGHGAAVEGNTAEFVTVVGVSAVVLANDVGAGGLEVVGEGALVQGNDVPDGMIYLSGTDSELLSNTSRGAWAANADGLLAQGNTLGGWGLEVAGDGAVVQGNVVFQQNDYYATTAIAVAGDGTHVLDNDVDTDQTGIRTWGADVEIAGNDVLTGGPGIVNPGIPSIVADVDGGVTLIEGNDVQHLGTGGIFVNGDGATVASNDVLSPDGSPGNGIQVIGDAALVTENACIADDAGGNACGIVIDGSTAFLMLNVVTGSATDGIEIWRGDGNVVSACDITDVGRCGIWIQNQATASVVTGVTSDVSLVGFMNLAEGTELSDSTLTGNRCMDVLSVTDLVNFTGNTFNTFSADINVDPILVGGD